MFVKEKGKYGMEILNFEAIAIWDGDEAYASSMDYNALFQVDVKTGACLYRCMFNERFDKRRLFTVALKTENKIYFVPSSADKIAVYEPKTDHLYDVEINDVDKEKYKFYRKNEKFNGGILMGKYLYMTPCTYPGMIRIDTYTDHVQYFSDWVSDGNYMFRKSPYVDKKIIWLPCTKGNKILRFDTETCSGQLLELPTKQLGWWSMCKADECFWISPRNPGPIMCWDIKNNLVKEYDEYPGDFIGENFYFTYCFNHNDKVYFLPAKSNMGVSIETQSRKLQEWKIDHVRNGTMTNYMVRLGNNVYIRITDDKEVYCCKLDCDSLRFTDFYFKFEQGLEKFRDDIKKNIIMNKIILKEKGDINLELFISSI